MVTAFYLVFVLAFKLIFIFIPRSLSTHLKHFAIVWTNFRYHQGLNRKAVARIVKKLAEGGMKRTILGEYGRLMFKEAAADHSFSFKSGSILDPV